MSIIKGNFYLEQIMRFLTGLSFVSGLITMFFNWRIGLALIVGMWLLTSIRGMFINEASSSTDIKSYKGWINLIVTTLIIIYLFSSGS
jgi:hypothetical protein